MSPTPPCRVGVLGLSLQVPTAFGAEPTVLRWLRIAVWVWAGRRVVKALSAMGAELGFLRHFLAAVIANQSAHGFLGY